MITLPASPPPSGASPALIDFGFILRPSTGAGALRVNRPGSRWLVKFSYPPMRPDVARVFISRLIEAKSAGLRIKYPLQVSQGNPGAALVDGGGAAGTSLPVKGLTPHYLAKEGYWLSVTDAAGVKYLHNVRATASADAAGKVTLTIRPPLRAPLVNGDAIELAAPMIEGLVTSDIAWPIVPDQVIDLSFSVEEAA